MTWKHKIKKLIYKRFFLEKKVRRKNSRKRRRQRNECDEKLIRCVMWLTVRYKIIPGFENQIRIFGILKTFNPKNSTYISKFFFLKLSRQKVNFLMIVKNQNEERIWKSMDALIENK